MCPLALRRGLWTAALLLPLLAGCSGEATVSGTVTLDGEPVDAGFITFYPVDRRGVNRGGEISGGRYTVRDLTPGKKRVRVVAHPRAELVSGAPRSERRFRLVPPKTPIPTGSAGNDEVVEIKTGPQTRDFTLRRPGRKN